MVFQDPAVSLNPVYKIGWQISEAIKLHQGVQGAEADRRAIDALASFPAGLVIYNAPGIGITLSSRLIERLSDMDHVIGLKQGDLSPATIDQLSNRLGGKIRLFCASDLAFLGPLTAGFDGLSSTNSCALPELILASYRAIEAGDARTATRLHKSWFAYRELARRFGQPQTVKAAMNHRGWAGGVVRPPLQPLTRGQSEELAEVLNSPLATGKPDEGMQHAVPA
jgi:4-hydroxy-tetrahydrodipicolinate synthase